MEGSLKSPQANTVKHASNIQNHQPQASTVASAPAQKQQAISNQKGLSHANAEQVGQKGVAKQIHAAGSGRDSESSHRLSFLLQAAHLVQGTSSPLSR
jgi:hypothetical protein